MKKLPNIGLDKILLFSGFTLALTMAGFWHHRQNATTAENLATFQQGVSTCFARVTQTFTAAMIKDMKSPYLNKDFMSLSDECLRESSKTSEVDLKAMPKIARLHNELVSDTYWFHEKVMKVIGGMSINSKDSLPMNGVSEKYAKIEGLKLDLADQLDINLGQVREARMRDEFLMGTAFSLFMLALSFLAMRRARTMRTIRDIERQALSLLNTGNVNVGAMVDQLLGRALTAAEMPISLRVFRDYHGEVLEVMSSRTAVTPEAHMEANSIITAPVAEIDNTDSMTKEISVNMEAATIAGIDIRHLLINQATRLNISLEVQDGTVVADDEALSQIIQSMGQRYSGWNPTLEGKSIDGRYIVRLIADGVCLNSSELEYVSRIGAKVDGVDINIVMACDMAREEGINFRVANRIGTDGSIVGSEAILDLSLVPNRNLTNIVRGKKRELEKQLRNTLN